MASRKTFVFLLNLFFKFLRNTPIAIFFLTSYLVLYYFFIPFFISQLFFEIYRTKIYTPVECMFILKQILSSFVYLFVLFLISSFLSFVIEIHFRRFIYSKEVIQEIYSSLNGYNLKFFSNLDNLDQRYIQENEEIIRLAIPLFFNSFGGPLKAVAYLSSEFSSLPVYSGFVLEYSWIVNLFLASYFVSAFGLFLFYSRFSASLLDKWDSTFAEYRAYVLRVVKNRREIFLLRGQESEIKELSLLSASLRKLIESSKALFFLSSFFNEFLFFKAGFFFFNLFSFLHFLKVPTFVLKESIFYFKSVDSVLPFFFLYCSSFEKICIIENSCSRILEIKTFLKKHKNLNKIKHTQAKPLLSCKDVFIQKPNNTFLFSVGTLQLDKSSLIMGKSGSGKSTFLKAIWGFWPYFSGEISLACKKPLFIPQRPYLPKLPLFKSIAYPLNLKKKELVPFLKLFFLEHLVPELNKIDYWDKKLSFYEQNLINYVKIAIHKPDLVFCDEISSNLDTRVEEACFLRLNSTVPSLIQIAIGHKETLKKFYPNVYLLRKHSLEKWK